MGAAKMGTTTRHAAAVRAAEMLGQRQFSSIGNPENQKLRVFAAPSGRQLAILLSNKTLTLVTEPVYTSTTRTAGKHKRRYGANETRHSNLNFQESRLAIGSAIDYWTFESLADFQEFLAWYGDRPVPPADAQGSAHIEAKPIKGSLGNRNAGICGKTDAPVSEDLFNRFKPTLLSQSPPLVRDPRLLLDTNGNIRIYYAPFEYLNPSARVVLVGITPGPTQMKNANLESRKALMLGERDSDAMRKAKETAAFSGEPMRGNLIRQMDHWGIHDWLGLRSSAELFSSARQLLQSTSLLRYPVFVNDEDYRGDPDMLTQPLLRRYLLEYFADEVSSLNKAIFFGLGPKVQRVLNTLVTEGLLPQNRVLGGMLHPSGNCTYRIKFLTGRRDGPLPHATNTKSYDAGRTYFRDKFLQL